MKSAEVKRILTTFEIVVDTREHPNTKFKKRIRSMGVPAVWHKLDFGDYSARVTLPDGSKFDLFDKVVIERKMSLDELCACYTHNRDRFTNEFERAKAANAKTYLLIESGDIEKAYKGKYRSKMKSKALVASIFTWMSRYDCIYLSCPADLSGLVIKDILYREMKERLLND